MAAETGALTPSISAAIVGVGAEEADAVNAAEAEVVNAAVDAAGDAAAG